MQHSRAVMSIWPMLLVSMAFSEQNHQNAANKLKELEGEWRGVQIIYKDIADPTRRIGVQPLNGEIRVKFIGNIGIVYSVQEGGRLDRAPFVFLVNIETNPISCDCVADNIKKGQKPNIYFVGICKLEKGKLHMAFNKDSDKEANRPKSFDPENDPKCTWMIILERP